MNKKSLSERIFNKIKEKKIIPRPRWEFLLKNYIVWLLGVISLIIGSLSVSVIIFMFKFSDFDIYESLHNNFFEFLISNLPYFWIIFLILFIVVADYNFKQTKKGYKYKLSTIILSSIIISIFLGSSLFAFGSGELIDNIMSRQAPFYSELINRNIKNWDNPEGGKLIGIVAAIQKNDLNLLTHDQKEWVVFYNSNQVLPQKEIKVGEPIRIIGEKQEENIFKAKQILLMPPPGREFINRNRKDMQRLMPNFNDPEEKNRMKEMIKKMEKYPELRETMMERLEMAPLEMKQNLKKELGLYECLIHSDCKTPFEYMVRSDCPFESRCLENKCRVVCPRAFDSKLKESINKKQCGENKDCQCEHYKDKNINNENCRCVEGQCLAIVE
ncbi:hypothetical protein A2331_01180 [Candidatus Falkowbacteria bacterium RIFOXYB2_FULL_34_18]|uniref:Uncharacterized protein n=1 Tax=Candidatus Falkowbacteria bacterium RIFOXYD2_FULL_34_120 TaxID=1798007 RepID=A0A1F5TPG4_9BACT|nr:MAG: hypothetical protein A2331_01180 [Candidatus Falkowbacteria bacterium RIFOXYB2_FULL_34_18]OGF29127.1 MAG: hypothetical protein A2500_02790 [Candidatus Falkowbacteria bacterium RIFOXYC12_FULL_34_55]OGF36223.1 MAG: hypothetical protein A2466_04960 [Candidatus Falkowbacteria bacterium RIFOXYC2_FULL_34_220]OGF38637.1 MAG: hypothetical protein A2515_06920 [Candidatus Falkowbacteria bacterium RIFOXYD12_FULL_34_57]OGF40826.1 MAG: hypothetical protein A2531_06625 [Candidatus Falkowbacteria bact